MATRLASASVATLEWVAPVGGGVSANIGVLIGWVVYVGLVAGRGELHRVVSRAAPVVHRTQLPWVREQQFLQQHKAAVAEAQRAACTHHVCRD